MNERKSKNLWPKDNVKMEISMEKREEASKTGIIIIMLWVCVGPGYVMMIREINMMMIVCVFEWTKRK